MPPVMMTTLMPMARMPNSAIWKPMFLKLRTVRNLPGARALITAIRIMRNKNRKY